jgi:hypothetical protein
MGRVMLAPVKIGLTESGSSSGPMLGLRLAPLDPPRVLLERVAQPLGPRDDLVLIDRRAAAAGEVEVHAADGLPQLTLGGEDRGRREPVLNGVPA